ncbi:MAG: T9SS type A sorting domain-containing protein [Bacteroidetes bacterium]|nr:T9SS type A sorting domain-containing protein [Bacteroidota bacterium]
MVNDLNAKTYPASEIININTTTITIYYVELINASGEIIQRNYPNDVNVAISLNGFKPGIYLARVYKHNQIIEKCFVVI